MAALALDLAEEELSQTPCVTAEVLIPLIDSRVSVSVLNDMGGVNGTLCVWIDYSALIMYLETCLCVLRII